MTFIFGVTGKGGVGKTTFAALLIRALIEKKKGVVLAVDADPNYNLNEKLGVKIENTIGGLREDIVKAVDSLPSSMSKHEYVEYQVRLALTESENFDLLVMGRQEGPGCYCYINNILRSYVDTLSENYDFIIIDNEAGMEHLSRRTTKAMDVLFVVSDASKIGVDTAYRIKNLSSAMELKIGKYVLIINRAPEKIPQAERQAERDAHIKRDFDEVYTLPNDDVVGTYNMEGRSLLTLSKDSEVAVEVASILSKVLEENKGG
jgi:CO dehydrogenase maturation factor